MRVMRCILVAAALMARAHVGNVAVVAPRQGLLGRVLMHVGIPAPVEHFEGTFYGVRAKLDLNMRTRIAMVHIKGAPVGGSVSGTGWLKANEAESGPVVLEPEFKKRLARRFVSVHSARLDRKLHTVTVSLKVPVLGRIDLTLK